MSGETPRRTVRIPDDEWEQIQREAEAAGKSAAEHLLDTWRASHGRKIPRLYVAAETDAVRQHLELALKRLAKMVR